MYKSLLLIIALVTGCALKPEVPIQNGCSNSACYQVIDGKRVIQGDIYIDKEEDGIREAITSTSTLFKSGYWANGEIPFAFTSDFPNPERVYAAIQHVEQMTSIRFIPRTTQRDFVTFRPKPGGACYANIGRIGGQQFIDLGEGCLKGQVIHEIGHVLGLWHEQGRADRDSYVTVHFENVIPEFKSAFDQNLSQTNDWGAYDYYSIMHYPPYGFSKNGHPTLTRKNGSIDIGQRASLSSQDIAAIETLYRGIAPMKTIPLNLVGVQHVIVGAPAKGVGGVYVWNSESLQLMGAMNPFPGLNGGIISAVGDLNRDGVLDVAVGVAGGGGPRVIVYSGNGGSVLRDYFAYAPNFLGGLSVALGDLNGDGYSEVITGAGGGGAPHVLVFDGLTGQVVSSFFAYEESFRGGVQVAALDTNQDGKAELLIGTGAGGGPRVRLFSWGASGLSILNDFFAFEESFRGGVKVSGVDWNRDGKEDLLIGTGIGGSPRTIILNGHDIGDRLASFFVGNPNSRYGISISGTYRNGEPILISGEGGGGSSMIRLFDRNQNEISRFVLPGEAAGVFVSGK